jgi:indoleamine 2,3-dioxygenase
MNGQTGDKGVWQRGFLPSVDPLWRFPEGSPYAVLDQWGEALPEWLEDKDFRRVARQLDVPVWQEPVTADNFPVLRLYYVRLGFLASGYINQVGEARSNSLPRNLAEPLCHVCALLDRPPILSYDGYALYNWRRLDPSGPVALGNIDTIQNFVSLYDEHWFILVHVAIEVLAGRMIEAMLELSETNDFDDPEKVDAAISTITEVVNQQRVILERIPENMSPDLYFKCFRPYIRFFENVVYEGVEQAPTNFRGETGAQSSVMPCLVAFFNIPHQPTELTDHLADMRRYMPWAHRELIERIEVMPPVRPVASPEVFNAAMEAIAQFREVHFGWAKRYIDEKVTDPRGTGGTPYMKWLSQLIGETRGYCK